jgi:D-xylose transport system ATP-binding protein
MQPSLEEVQEPARPLASAPHLQVAGIRKSFGAVEALRGADLSVERGQVMGLVGDNGAGKSTLMKVLAGAIRCDSGRFLIDGREVTISSPHDAAALGVQIVYQDLALCENLDVAANMFLGKEITAGWARFLPRMLRPILIDEMETLTREAVASLHVRTLHALGSKVGDLSGGQRQALAIARAVRARSSIVLLDEPTAALGVAQTRQVLEVVQRLRETGYAVIYISHNLRDVFEVCDAITVLRHGANAAVYSTEQTTPEEVVMAMTRGVPVRTAGHE